MATILFEGALTLDFRRIRGNPAPIRNLLTIGALVTFAGASFLAHAVLGFGPSLSIVTGAILIVTGPTVVTPLLPSRTSCAGKGS